MPSTMFFQFPIYFCLYVVGIGGEAYIFEDLRYDKLHLIIGRSYKFQKMNFHVLSQGFLN